MSKENNNNSDKVHEISIDQIECSDTNVRRSQAERGLDELAASITKHGLLQPVLLRGEYGNPYRCPSFDPFLGGEHAPG